MPRVLLDGDLDHLVTPTHSDARGPVVRGKSIEMMKMHWRAGDSARPHQHAEEQAIYVISGRMRMTCGDETYEIGPGEVGFVIESRAWVADALDVPPSSLFHDAVVRLFRNGVSVGCGGGLYCVNTSVSRAQIGTVTASTKVRNALVSSICR